MEKHLKAAVATEETKYEPIVNIIFSFHLFRRDGSIKQKIKKMLLVFSILQILLFLTIFFFYSRKLKREGRKANSSFRYLCMCVHYFHIQQQQQQQQQAASSTKAYAAFIEFLNPI